MNIVHIMRRCMLSERRFPHIATETQFQHQGKESEFEDVDEHEHRQLCEIEKKPVMQSKCLQTTSGPKENRESRARQSARHRRNSKPGLTRFESRSSRYGQESISEKAPVAK